MEHEHIVLRRSFPLQAEGEPSHAQWHHPDAASLSETHEKICHAGVQSIVVSEQAVAGYSLNQQLIGMVYDADRFLLQVAHFFMEILLRCYGALGPLGRTLCPTLERVIGPTDCYQDDRVPSQVRASHRIDTLFGTRCVCVRRPCPVAAVCSDDEISTCSTAPRFFPAVSLP